MYTHITIFNSWIKLSVLPNANYHYRTHSIILPSQSSDFLFSLLGNEALLFIAYYLFTESQNTQNESLPKIRVTQLQENTLEFNINL